MNAFPRLILALLAAFVCVAAPAAERIHVDPAGVMRWTADDREVALFGANYCLPSSSDYRAAGYLGVDRKQLIEQDMTHFARMGWDGLRLAIWGDWENCDREGNLIANDHLDLFDYLIFQAKRRGISMLFTPIHRHSALWPDGRDSDAIQGFAKFYPPSDLGTNPAAIAAQQNYIRQFLEHVNPYTGVAIKDEPAILFIELINEPEHHADDFAGSVAYIDALAQAVRDTGCEKLLFFNLSQDFRMSPALAASQAQGLTFGWYPTALVTRRTLDENYLRWVDRYTPLHDPAVPPLPRLVYEFDSADMVSGYMYPAMVRAYREVGAQFAAMFAYDMLATAPYNLGWQTHFLNLVHSPRKAVSAIIAAEAMRTLPRGENYGAYPHNRRFGPFRVSYEEDSSEMVTDEKFLHANDTATTPPNPAALRQIVGTGSSPVVRYEGLGAYFFDQLADGQWRLEVYPDAIFVQDPFAQRLNYQTVSSRLIWRTWPMQLALPNLGAAFSVTPLDDGNTHRATTTDASFPIRPGVYLLSRDSIEPAQLPGRVGQIGLREFVCPPAPDLPTQVVPHLRAEYPSDQPLTLAFDLVAATPPTSAVAHVRTTGATEARTILLTLQRGYRFTAELAADSLPPGAIEISVALETDDDAPFSSPTWTARIVEPRQPLVLLDPTRDAGRWFTLRTVSDRPGGYIERLAATAGDPAALRLHSPTAPDSRHAVSLPIKSHVIDRRTAFAHATRLRLAARGTAPSLDLALIDADGRTRTATVSLASSWQQIDVPLNTLRPGAALKLPQGYPGNWNRDLPPPEDDAPFSLERTEHLQLSTSFHADAPAGAFADIASVEILFD